MNRISDKKKCMASLAVFKNLYNSKKNIYDVIAEFAKLTIAERGLKSFVQQEMVNYINQDYGFDLPIAVIRNALKRIKEVKKEGDTYIINSSDSIDFEEICNTCKNEETVNQEIFDKLYNFVESKTKRELTKQERNNVLNDFCTFVLYEKNNSKYEELITQFIVENSQNDSFRNQLNQILQGLVIYVGLNYNTDYNSIDKIDTPLHIYIDTEILFYIGDLNGPLYLQLFNEFYNLVQEINKKAGKQIIKLLYFRESYDEICKYFSIAERIIRKEERLDPSKMAMRNIVNGCHEPSDIIAKRTAFFSLLKDRGITLDSQSRYYDQDINYEFLIDAKAFYDIQDEEITEKEIDRKVNLLNYISIKRGNRRQDIFRSVGHILLSANKLTFKIAFDSNIRKEGTIPLATYLSYLTNRFWFTLNKGLSSSNILHSMDVIAKAQIALSTRINDNIGRLYQEFVKKDNEGNFDSVKEKEILASLHGEFINPDQLTPESASGYMDILNVNDIETYISEKEAAKLKLQNEKEELVCKIEDLSEKHFLEVEFLKEVNEKKESALLNAAKQILKDRNANLEDDYNKKYDEYIQNRNEYISEIIKKRCAKSCISVLIHLVIVVILILCTGDIIEIKYEYWNSFTKVLSLIIAAIPFFRPLIDHKPLSTKYKFILCKNYREAIKFDLEKEYEKKYPKPKLSKYSLDDVLLELEKDF